MSAPGRFRSQSVNLIWSTHMKVQDNVERHEFNAKGDVEWNSVQ